MASTKFIKNTHVGSGYMNGDSIISERENGKLVMKNDVQAENV